MYAHSNFNWFKKAKHKDAPAAKYFEVILGFAAPHSTVIDGNTEIKIELSDNSFETYKQFSDEPHVAIGSGAVIFNVSLNDKLFTTNIKTIRIATSDTNNDFDIPEKKAASIKNALIKIKTESDKQ